MTDQARSEIFARVRHASQRAGAGDIRNEHFRLGRSPIALTNSDDLNTAFLANVIANYGSVAVTRNRSETARQLGSYLFEKYRSRKLLVGGDPRLAAMPWRDGGLLPRFGAAEDGDLASVSYAQLAIAETGSIVSYTGRSNPAANNLLVEDHIVIVDAVDVVATLDDLWTRLEELPARLQRPRGINIISGPSSTADIEMHLVKGAHGPRSWHVILQGDVTDDMADRAHEIARSAVIPD